MGWEWDEGGVCTASMWWSEKNLLELVLSFLPVEPGEPNSRHRMGSKQSYLISRLAVCGGTAKTPSVFHLWGFVGWFVLISECRGLIVLSFVTLEVCDRFAIMLHNQIILLMDSRCWLFLCF